MTQQPYVFDSTGIPTSISTSAIVLNFNLIIYLLIIIIHFMSHDYWNEKIHLKSEIDNYRKYGR